MSSTVSSSAPASLRPSRTSSTVPPRRTPRGSTESSEGYWGRAAIGATVSSTNLVTEEPISQGLASDDTIGPKAPLLLASMMPARGRMAALLAAREMTGMGYFSGSRMLPNVMFTAT